MQHQTICRATRGWAISAVVALTSSVAYGQAEPTFNANRYRPAERGSRWFASDSIDAVPYQPLAVGATFDWAHRPLSVLNTNGDRVGDIVANQYYLHVGATYTLFDSFRIGLNVPLVLATTGSDWVVRNRLFAAGSGGGLSDIRLGADYRFLGERGSALRLAISVQSFLPTGNETAYAGNRVVRVYPRLLAAGDISILTWAISGGPDIRSEQDRFAGVILGSDFSFTAAVGLKVLEGSLVVGPEIYGVSRMANNKFFTSKGTPAEVVLGAHYAISENWMIGAAAGPGLTQGFGTPAARCLFSIDYAPGSKPAAAVNQVPADSDNDGISDTDDACPDRAGPRSEQPSENGCPPKDTDGDGLIDKLDACPNEAGIRAEDPKKDGCPAPKDADADGIVDELDACPNEAGVATKDPKTNGCAPPKDTDGDGISDEKDACPTQAGPANADPKKNGCALAAVVNDTIVITERVDFDNNKATLRPDAMPVLGAVLEVLKAHPEIKHLTVEGHTDNRGVAANNLTLSKQRAQTVVKWLVDHGIEAQRLGAVGRGQLQPIDDNTTDEGRQRNRRVEFHIQQQPSH